MGTPALVLLLCWTRAWTSAGFRRDLLTTLALPTAQAPLCCFGCRDLLFCSFSFPFSMNTCERALHLCARSHSRMFYLMLTQGLPLWKHPTFGGHDVKRDLVPTCVDVHLGHASPTSEKVPVQGNSRMCWYQGGSHVLGFVLLAVLISCPLSRLLPTATGLSLFFRAASAVLAAAEKTRASLYLLVHHCFALLHVFCTTFGTEAESLAYSVGRKLIWLASSYNSCKL